MTDDELQKTDTPADAPPTADPEAADTGPGKGGLLSKTGSLTDEGSFDMYTDDMLRDIEHDAGEQVADEAASIAADPAGAERALQISQHADQVNTATREIATAASEWENQAAGYEQMKAQLQADPNTTAAQVDALREIGTDLRQKRDRIVSAHEGTQHQSETAQMLKDNPALAEPGESERLVQWLISQGHSEAAVRSEKSSAAIKTAYGAYLAAKGGKVKVQAVKKSARKARKAARRAKPWPKDKVSMGPNATLFERDNALAVLYPSEG